MSIFVRVGVYVCSRRGLLLLIRAEGLVLSHRDTLGALMSPQHRGEPLPKRSLSDTRSLCVHVCDREKVKGGDSLCVWGGGVCVF